MNISDRRPIEINFQDSSQVLICGSTLFACQMALESADAGIPTALAMEKLHPFFEAIHCLNPWIKQDKAHIHTSLIQKTLSDPKLTRSSGDRLYFNMTEAAIEIEDRLCEAGVCIYYNSPVAGALRHEGHLGGVVFGGKPGLYAIESALVIDATLDATVGRTLGVPMLSTNSKDGLQRAHYSIERCRPTAYDEHMESYKAANGMEVQVENRSFYTHFDITYPSRSQTPLSCALEFRDLYEAALEYTPNLPSQRFRGADGYLRRGLDRVRSKDGAVSSSPNMRIFSPTSISDNQNGQLSLLDHTFLFEAFPQELRKDVLASASPVIASKSRPCYEFCNESVAPASDDSTTEHRFTDPDAIFPGMEKGTVTFTPPASACSRPLAIIGTGTSGVAASIQSADLEIDTISVDAGAELGGTVTLGGVTNLWYGNKTRGFSEYYRRAGAENDGLNAPPFFRRIAESKHLEFLPLTSVCGVAVSKRKLNAVYVVTPCGLSSITFEHAIDATGDASLAAWAGCDYHFGSERDELTLWASLGSFEHGRPEGARQFLTPLDERSPEDTRRAIQSMRRFKNRGPSPAFLLTPRESRHIRSEKHITMLDTMAGRRFADAILRFRANLDLKGNSSSDLSHVGLLSRTRFRNHEVSLPYASLIPDNLDNLLVVGKAYGATSDAMGLARMQRDLAMMGRAASHAMNQCVRNEVSTRSISVKQLQDTLIHEGIMEECDAAADDLGITDSPETLLQSITNAEGLEESLEPTAKLILLEREHGNTSTPDPDLADLSAIRYLCVQKDSRGIAACEQLLQGWLDCIDSVIPEEDRMPASMGHLLPDHAFAPEPLYWLMALAQAQNELAAPACTQIAEAIAMDESINFNTLWPYVFAIAYSCDRVAGPDTIPPLETILDSSRFRNSPLMRGPDLRDSLNTEAERLSYLRLCLTRALARSGSLRGFHGLTEYLQSAHACYSRSARSELRALTGNDFLFDQERWLELLQASSFKPQRYEKHLE